MFCPVVGKKAAANSAYTGRRAPQDMKGAIIAVMTRSRRLSRVRVAITAGTLQPKPEDHRDERLAGKADGPHEAVHDEGGAGHVAGIFKERQEEEQEGDHRHEGRDGLDAGADAAGEQGDQPVGSAPAGHQLGRLVDQDRAEEHVEEVDEDAGEVDRKQEHHIHHHQEDGDAKRPAEHDGVDPVGNRLGRRGACCGRRPSLPRRRSDSGHRRR